MEIIVEPIKLNNNHSLFEKRSINKLMNNIDNIDSMFFSEGIRKKRLSIDKSIYIFSCQKTHPTEEERVAEYNKQQNLLLNRMMFG